MVACFDEGLGEGGAHAGLVVFRIGGDGGGMGLMEAPVTMATLRGMLSLVSGEADGRVLVVCEQEDMIRSQEARGAKNIYHNPPNPLSHKPVKKKNDLSSPYILRKLHNPCKSPRFVRCQSQIYQKIRIDLKENENSLCFRRCLFSSSSHAGRWRTASYTYTYTYNEVSIQM